MCVILDTNSVSEVLGPNKSSSGADLFNWIMKGGNKIVVGKMLFSELNIFVFKEWFSNALRTGKAIRIVKEDDDKVKKQCECLLQQGRCKSNDQHIIALAHISGSRLLYTRDNNLISDFKDLVKGKIYPLGNSNNAKKARNRIHQDKKLCARLCARQTDAPA